MSGVERDKLQPRLLIVANAGSGKTHELVTRCVKLLSLGQSPEEILALTFTRKAAAEFLQQLFERLGDAAGSEEKRSALAGSLGLETVSRGQCIAWMHQLLGSLPRLSMGTMDQFFGRIVRSFPFELGIGRDFEVLDAAAQQENLRRTLEKLFKESAGDDEGLRELVELLRQNSRDRSDASALRALQEDVAKLHQQIAGPSKSVRWGDEKRIWPSPKKCEFLESPPLARAAQTFWDEVQRTQQAELAPALENYLKESVRHAKSRAAGAGLGTKLSKFAGYLGNKWKFVVKDNAEALRFGNHGRLLDRGNLRQACGDLRSSLIGAELRSRLTSSAALYRLLRRYDDIYERTVRETGALTFADVTEILTGHSGKLKDDVAYRLDSRHKHWLLDEFQDTSRAQWDVIEPLVAEVLMDTSDERTFFYVGDTKQSIYGWRGGDDRLFREIFRHYNKHSPGHIDEAQLDVSWRSDRAIIEVVNAVFNDSQVAALADDFALPPAAVERWKSGWVPHKWRSGAGPGFVRLHDLAQGADEDDNELIDRGLVRLIRDEVKPLERGFSCAVLTRSGKMADHYAKVLEKAGIKAVTEGSFDACESNPESLALMAAVRFVASPTDRIAEEHFLATPFGCLLEGATDKEKFSRFRAGALKSAAEEGFAATVRGWVDRAAARKVVDPAKVTALLDASAEFEAKRKPADNWRTFINYLGHYTQQENEAPGAVRVMTIHQAKGLGMDVVILPELGGHQSLSQLKTSGISLVRDGEGRVRWGLDLPASEICDADEELKLAREGMKADQTFGELCVFYVAMTRAKHAVYCLTAEKQNRKNAARWLMETFPGGDKTRAVREVGQEDWFLHIKKDPPEQPKIIKGDSIRRPCGPEAGVPSSQVGEDLPAGVILGGGASRHLGTEVHEILARIEWLDDKPDLSGASPEAARLVGEFLGSESAAVLRRPDGPVLLWQERAFDVEIDGKPVSGIFDRVHIALGRDNRPVSAKIYDFKTDKETGDLGEKYRGQMKYYRAAAGLLLGLPPEAVMATPLPVRG